MSAAQNSSTVEHHKVMRLPVTQPQAAGDEYEES